MFNPSTLVTTASKDIAQMPTWLFSPTIGVVAGRRTSDQQEEHTGLFFCQLCHHM